MLPLIVKELDMLLYVMYGMGMLVVAAMVSGMVKYVKLRGAMRAYPAYGKCDVRIVWKRSLEDNSNVKGRFIAGKRVIEIAMNNRISNVIETYLHERRHSEQAFGNDIELTSMYAGSIGCLQYMRSVDDMEEEVLWDAYYMSDHEVDAREWTSTTIKDYLGR